MLSAELLGLKSLDFDLGLTGFSSRGLSALIDQPNQQNTVPAGAHYAGIAAGRPVVPRLHRVLCADSTDAASVARLLGDRKPALMVCDPPYGIGLIRNGVIGPG